MNLGRWIGGIVLAASVLGCSWLAIPTRTGLSQDQAVAIARAAAPRYADADILQARMGRFADLASPGAALHMPNPPAPDRLVWLVNLGEQPSPTGGEGAEVIIDFWDGTVVLLSNWVS